ncbi:PilZ domain-containing protein [Bradyrhizobium sp. AZCC 2230]|uniref:PilZ domain-containing protein n=1 Tax=Bradyrhizobium sp. AZCC 2230 TaxID=3117021 RepID=UPI003FA5FF8E
MSVEWTGGERRRVTRKTLEQLVTLSLPGEVTIMPCKMFNLSVLGACVRLKNTSIPSTDFQLSFDDFRTSFDCRLAWRQDDRAGISFVS